MAVGKPRHPIVPSRKVEVRRRAKRARVGNPGKSGATPGAVQRKGALMTAKRVNIRQKASKVYFGFTKVKIEYGPETLHNLAQ